MDRRMMGTDDRREWIDKFRRRDELFLSCVRNVWWSVVARLPSDADENDITKALVDGLEDDKVKRRKFDCHYQFPTIEWGPDGKLAESQFIDMAMVVDHDQRHYLAYECKKLNRRKDGGRRSQAGSYVREGMMRFVTEQYSKNLEVGCMMGYVMDGDVPFARSSVKAKIAQERNTLGLRGDPVDGSPLDVMVRFVTTHERPSIDIEIRHTLLPFMHSTQGDTDV